MEVSQIMPVTTVSQQVLKPAPSLGSLLDTGVTKFLYLDFDGVINSFRRSGTFKKEFFSPDNRRFHPNPTYVENSRPREPQKYELQWSTEMIDKLSVLLGNEDTQLIWLTTWRQYMASVVKRIGLTSTREQFYLPWGDIHQDDHYKKIGAFMGYTTPSSVNPHSNYSHPLQALLEPPVTPITPNLEWRAVWVDDVLFPLGGYAKKHNLGFPDKNLLLISPDERYGISREELKTIEGFLE